MRGQHHIKIESQYFESILSGEKRFEIRLNDRKYEVHDVLVMREIDTMREPTGRTLTASITYMSNYEQKPGYVVFGFKLWND